MPVSAGCARGRRGALCSTPAQESTMKAVEPGRASLLLMLSRYRLANSG
jgi:hypothetical protein